MIVNCVIEGRRTIWESSESRMTFLFVDTNVLLHYRRLEEIDWLTLTASREVTIFLCPAVIRELDRQKVVHPQQKIRRRPAVSEFVTSKQVSITLQGRGAGAGEGSP
jgi:hypothetical protein